MEEDRSFFVAFHPSSNFLWTYYIVCYASKSIGTWFMLYAVELILTIGILREFVMSLQVIIYAKQNGAQLATFAATGTRADIDDLRKKEDNGGPGNEVAASYNATGSVDPNTFCCT